MKRNITIAYFLSFAFHSWFWMGNWIFYYLIFGSYTTVAMLDSGAVLASLIMEVPTGAFADIMGKKKTLIIAFALQGVGSILMGLSNSLWMLAISLWLFVCVSHAFYSGTMDALVYDSLKVLKDEDSFAKKMGLLNATRLWSMALCAVVGGFFYQLSPGLPFILNGIVCLIGLVACFYLVEPRIDTEKYSLLSFFKQNTLGVKNLFGTQFMKRLSVYLIVTGSMLVLVYNILDDLLAVEWGYSPLNISLLFSAACLIAGFASMLVPKIRSKIDQRVIVIISIILMAFLLILSPIVGMIAGGVLLLFRVVMEVLYDNAASVMINKQIESRVRSTTLSSLSLLRSLPYAIFGTFLGSLVLLAGGARNFTMWYGFILMVLAILLGLRIDRKMPNGRSRIG